MFTIYDLCCCEMYLLMTAFSKRTRKCMYSKPFVLEKVTNIDSKLLVYFWSRYQKICSPDHLYISYLKGPPVYIQNLYILETEIEG